MNKFSFTIKCAGALACLMCGTALECAAQSQSLALPAKDERAASYEVKGHVEQVGAHAGFAGAHITSPNLKISAMTDEKGDFSLALPSLMVILDVEAPGCEPMSIALQGRSQVNIYLLASRDEAAALPVKREGEKLLMQGGAGHATQLAGEIASLLQGELRGLSASGEPAASSTLFVRGLNSLNISSQPLFVVDGVAWPMQEDNGCVVDNYYNNPLSLIDPRDVESVKVVKEENALWGAKAAGGVVFIETRRAREMATKIEVNLSAGMQPSFKNLPMMNADSYKSYLTDVMEGMDANTLKLLHFTVEDPSKSYYWSNHNRTRWLDCINKNGYSQDYGISVSGGDNIALYRFSLGYNKNEGNIKNTGFNRLNVRFNSDIFLTDKLSVQADISYAQTSRDEAFGGMDVSRSPYYIALVKSPLYHPYQYNGEGRLTDRLSDVDELNVGNPLSLVSHLPALDKYRFNLNVRPSYKFSHRLTLGVRFGFSWDKSNENAFIPDEGVADAPLYNDLGEVYAIALNEVRNYMARESTLSVDGNLGWNILKDYKNDLAVTAGGRFYSNYYHYTLGQGYNTGSDFMKSLSNTTADLRFLKGLGYTDREGAWYVDAGYNYMSRYFLKGSLSMESSSRFGSDAGGVKLWGASWGLFPSLSGKWAVASEKFMQSLPFVSNLDLRAAFTCSGNSNLPLFAGRTYFTSQATARDAGGPVLANIGNEGLKWESSTKWSVGMDLGLWNSRLLISADLYTSTTHDLLTRKSLDDVAGLHYYWDNDGELENRGFELSATAKIIEEQSFKLSAGFMMGHYHNEIKSLNNGSFVTTVSGGQILTQEGSAAGLFYGYRTRGIFSTAAQAREANLSIVSASGKKMAFGAGDIYFVDNVADGIIDEKDRVVLGDPNPDFYGNFNFALTYKQWTLSGLFTFSCGNDAYNALRASLESGSDILNQSRAMENRWRADGQITDVPRAVYGDPMGNSRFSDRWIEDASYVKVKRLSLTYQVPLKFHFIQGLSLWASADNLYTFTRYLGTDPEFSAGTSVLGQGVDTGLVPHTCSYSVGVNINL